MNVEEEILGPSLMLIKGQGINIIEKIRNKNNKVETKEREREINDICKKRFDLEEAIRSSQTITLFNLGSKWSYIPRFQTFFVLSNQCSSFHQGIKPCYLLNKCFGSYLTFHLSPFKLLLLHVVPRFWYASKYHDFK